MAFDVFLASANEDKDMAALVARRLRALKFKVRYSKKGEAPTFDDKDARDAARSTVMLVLWSGAAVRSDWVRAAASIGASKDSMLVHAALDSAEPDDPFGRAKRFDLVGFTTRTTVEGWYQTVEAIGDLVGRSDLRTWMQLAKTDEDGQAAWRSAHPNDPISIQARERRAAAEAKKLGDIPSIVTERTTPITEDDLLADGDEARDNPLLLWASLTGIAAMLFAAYAFRTPPLPVLPSGAIIAQTCPAGYMPANLLSPKYDLLNPGQVIDDTSDTPD